MTRLEKMAIGIAVAAVGMSLASMRWQAPLPLPPLPPHVIVVDPQGRLGAEIDPAAFAQSLLRSCEQAGLSPSQCLNGLLERR